MQTAINDIYGLKPRALWRVFASSGFAFWMACAYLFFEYVRPQAIWSILELYPYWARTFLILGFLGWLMDPKKQFVWNWMTTGIFVFLGVIIAASFTAYWPAISREYWMDYFNWVVVFFVLTQTTTTRERFIILLLIFMIASFKLSFYGARTWTMMGFGFSDWGLRGPRGFFENPGELAIQMLVFAPLALFFIIGIRDHIRKRWQLWLLYLVPLTAAMTVMGTNTRGGQLALAVQIVLLILMTKHRFKALIGVAILAVAAWHLLPEEQKERFEASGEDPTSMQRLLYWEHGWQMMKDHPFLGVGYFNFPPYFTRFHAEDLILPQLERAELPHNIFIQVGTDTGFIGLSIFIGMIAGCYLAMLRAGAAARGRGDPFVENITKGMNLALIGYVIAGQFVTVAYYPYLWIHLVFATAILTFVRNELSAAARQQRPQSVAQDLSAAPLRDERAGTR